MTFSPSCYLLYLRFFTKCVQTVMYSVFKNFFSHGSCGGTDGNFAPLIFVAIIILSVDQQHTFCFM